MACGKWILAKELRQVKDDPKHVMRFLSVKARPLAYYTNLDQAQRILDKNKEQLAKANRAHEDVLANISGRVSSITFDHVIPRRLASA